MHLRIALLLAMLAWTGPAFAQGKAIQFIVPFPPGGSADGIARIVATELGERLKRQVVVENKPGAGGGLGLQLLSKAPPDGDTLAVGATGALVINPHVPGSSGFDPLRETTPIAKLIDIPIVLVSNAKTGPQSVKEMLDRSKSTAGGLSFGTTGANSSQHLAIELLKKVTGANLVHVPYRGSAPAAMAVIGDQVPLASVDLTSGHPHIKAGTLKALATSTAKRSSAAPDLVTLREAGVDLDAGLWFAIWAPAGTPQAAIDKLSRTGNVAIASAAAKAIFAAQGFDAIGGTPEDFVRAQKDDIAKWKLAVEAAGLRK